MSTSWVIVFIITFFLLIILFSFPSDDPVVIRNNIFEEADVKLRDIISRSDICHVDFRLKPTRGEAGYTTKGFVLINYRVSSMTEIVDQALPQISAMCSDKYQGKSSQLEIYNDLNNIYEQLKG